jgi:hypothetical protein
MASLARLSAVLVVGRTFTNVAPCSPLDSPLIYVAMGWFQPELLTEESSVHWTLSGPRVPRSAFTLHEATRKLSQLRTIRHGPRHV